MFRLGAAVLVAGAGLGLVLAGAPAPAGASGVLSGYLIPGPAGWSAAPSSTTQQAGNSIRSAFHADGRGTQVTVEAFESPDKKTALVVVLVATPKAEPLNPAAAVRGSCAQVGPVEQPSSRVSGVPHAASGTCRQAGKTARALVFTKANVIAELFSFGTVGAAPATLGGYAQAQYQALPTGGVSLASAGKGFNPLTVAAMTLAALAIVGLVLALIMLRRRPGDRANEEDGRAPAATWPAQATAPPPDGGAGTSAAPTSAASAPVPTPGSGAPPSATGPSAPEEATVLPPAASWDMSVPVVEKVDASNAPMPAFHELVPEDERVGPPPSKGRDRPR